MMNVLPTVLMSSSATADFEMGDLEDSRTWGPIETSALVARVLLIWLSLDWFNEASDVRDWPRVSWDRVLTTVR